MSAAQPEGPSPAPWRWMHTPDVHKLDPILRAAEDEEWDGKPGWDEVGETYLCFDQLLDADGDEVLYAAWHSDYTADIGVGAADARLISAAPKLLEACELAEQVLRLHTPQRAVRAIEEAGEMEHYARARIRLEEAAAEARGLDDE